MRHTDITWKSSLGKPNPSLHVRCRICDLIPCYQLPAHNATKCAQGCLHHLDICIPSTNSAAWGTNKPEIKGWKRERCGQKIIQMLYLVFRYYLKTCWSVNNTTTFSLSPFSQTWVKKLIEIKDCVHSVEGERRGETYTMMFNTKGRGAMGRRERSKCQGWDEWIYRLPNNSNTRNSTISETNEEKKPGYLSQRVGIPDTRNVCAE